MPEIYQVRTTGESENKSSTGEATISLKPRSGGQKKMSTEWISMKPVLAQKKRSEGEVKIG